MKNKEFDLKQIEDSETQEIRQLDDELSNKLQPLENKIHGIKENTDEMKLKLILLIVSFTITGAIVGLIAVFDSINQVSMLGAYGTYLMTYGLGYNKVGKKASGFLMQVSYCLVCFL